MIAETINADPALASFGLPDEHKEDWTLKDQAIRNRILQSRITDQTPVKRLATAITIAGSTFARFGDFSLIMGQRKAGKTTILQYVIATAFMVDVAAGVDTMQIRTAHCEGKDVIYVDTEGSNEDTKDFIEGVKRILGVDDMPENFHVYHWREMDQKECRECMEVLFRLHPEMRLCVIDGIADLVSKVNDEGESNETVRFIMKNAGQFNVCVICVIHENPVRAGQEAKARGHFGSELERKASGAISVEKNREEKRHYIKSRFLRKSEDFEPVMFWFEDNHPVSRILTIEEKTRLKDKDYQKVKTLSLLRDRCFLGMDSKAEKDLKISIELYQGDSPSKEATRKKRDRNIDDLLRHNLIRPEQTDGKLFYFPIRELSNVVVF